VSFTLSISSVTMLRNRPAHVLRGSLLPGATSHWAMMLMRATYADQNGKVAEWSHLAGATHQKKFSLEWAYLNSRMNRKVSDIGRPLNPRVDQVEFARRVKRTGLKITECRRRTRRPRSVRSEASGRLLLHHDADFRTVTSRHIYGKSIVNASQIPIAARIGA